MKHCKVCNIVFTPARPLQSVCSPRCASKKVKADKAAEKQRDKERKEKLKGIPDYIKEADKAFQAYIRERDKQAGYPCISSGKPLDWSGNQVDSGHYRSKGAASHLRYNENNCHAQSKIDNQWKAGNIVEYRIRLIERIGLEAVERLEQDNKPHKWTREELKQIKDTYTAKLKQLQNEKKNSS
jgi:hypothetical protein